MALVAHDEIVRPQLLDRSTVVSDDGWYEIFASFPPGTNGIVTATVTDRDGLESNMAIAGVQS